MQKHGVVKDSHPVFAPRSGALFLGNEANTIYLYEIPHRVNVPVTSISDGGDPYGAEDVGRAIVEPRASATADRSTRGYI
jgi:hypothetical protein